MGVWIEIADINTMHSSILVTPFMGVWIEIPPFVKIATGTLCHSLYGSVD